MGKSTISMAIFNSYVSLPEGSQYLHRSCEESESVGRLGSVGSGVPVVSTWPGKDAQKTIGKSPFIVENHHKYGKIHHRNSGFSHETWWIFPQLCNS